MPDQGLLDVLRRSGGLVAVATRLDIAPGTAATVAGALMPLVRGGFRRRVELSENLSSGLAELLDLLEGLGGGDLASRVLQQAPLYAAAGETILSAVFGGDAIQRAVIADAAKRSGSPPQVVSQVLSMLAVLAAGYVSARAGRMSAAERLAELGPLLDLDGEPNPLDAIIAIAEQSAP